MKEARRQRLPWLMLVVCIVVAGCSEKGTLGAVQMTVTLPQALGASDVARVELTVTGAGMAPRTELLTKTGGQWGGLLGGLPEGTGRTFLGEAFDSANTRIYAGQVEDVTIVAGQTTAVTMVLQEVTAPEPFENAAPVITSVIAGPATVRPGGVVTLRATAEDPNAGDSLTFAWTAGAGSFSAPSSLTTTWTAPAAAAPVVLTLTVTDSKGATAALSLTVTVSSSPGSAAVKVTVNTWPQVARVTATPSPVAVGQTTTVVASAGDSDGDELSYAWTSDCQGTWVNSSSSSASFTPTTQPPAAVPCASCALTVTVEDGRGGQTTGTLSICVGPVTAAHFPPEVVETYQSAAEVPTTGSVTFRVRAADVQDSALTFSWTANVGTVGTATSGASTSEVAWTAPACVPAGTQPEVTVTVANALGLSTSAVFSLQGASMCPPAVGYRFAVGGLHTVVLMQDGALWAWGENGDGQFGDGTNESHVFPAQVQAASGVTAVSAGILHTVTLRQDGTLWSFGQNGHGQLGDGTTDPRNYPVQVQGLTHVAAIHAGSEYTVALKQDRTVWAWGDNAYGQLGDGTLVRRALPVQVQGLSGVIAISASSTHTVALRQDGTVWGWGRNLEGQLGDGTTTHRVTTPVQTQGLSGVIAVSAGGMHTLALRQDGTVWACGENTYGQLGDGTTNRRRTMVQVRGLSDVTAIAAGGVHNFALRQDGTVWAWGVDTFVHPDEGPPKLLTPVQVQDLSGVISVAIGGHHNVVLLQDGTLWAWGENFSGQIGNGTYSDYVTSPVQVLTLGD